MSAARTIAFTLAAATLFSLAAAAHADNSISLHPSQDVTLFGAGTGSDATGNKTGSGPGLFVGIDSGPTGAKRGLVQFDIAGNIPAGVQITGVTLTLYLAMTAGSGGSGTTGDPATRTIRLYDVIRPWSPSTQINNGTLAPTNPLGGTGHGYAHTATDPGASWNYATFNSNPALATPWTTAGGDFTGNSEAVLGSMERADTGVTNNFQGGYNWTDARMIADVQSWLDTPSTNDGWLLKNDSETGMQTFRAFYTDEGAIEYNFPALRPTLTVTFTPEPASLTLIAGAAEAMLLSRRRK